MDGVITAAAVLLAVVGGLLVGDVLRVWRLDRASVAGPERAQVLTGVTILVFATAFLLAHGGGEQTQAAPAVTAVPETSALTRLATPARPPALQAPDENRPNRDRNRRPHGNAEAPAEPAPAEPPTTTTTTSVPTTTTPAPTTTTPPPAPTAPSQGPVPFDSRE